MRLLVTGGVGYIGSIVARQLGRQGNETVLFDNLEPGHRAALAPAIRLVVADLLDADAPRGLLQEGFDAVLRFAALALVAESVSHPERYYRTNVGGTLNLLEATRDAEVERLVFSSTCWAFAQANPDGYSEEVGDSRHGLGEHQLGLLRRVDHSDPVGRSHRKLGVGSRDPSVKSVLLALEAVEVVAAGARARTSERRIDRQQQRPVGDQAPSRELVDLADRFDVELTAAALVRQ
jgi:NAD dependent epimerase/dehydratase family